MVPTDQSALLKPAALILCFLAATAFLASDPKFDFITGLRMHKTGLLTDKLNNSDPLMHNTELRTDKLNSCNLLPDNSKQLPEWPNRNVWARLSREPRLPYNRCPYAHCPTGSEWINQSRFVHPFDAEDTCPFYFSYIHEDLAPWATHRDVHSDDDHLNYTSNNTNKYNAGNCEETGNLTYGISKGMLDNATSFANFRVVIKRGKLYVEAYRKMCFQTRAIFTIWGLLQLLKFYPGLVPNVDMLFGCEDIPRVSKTQHNDNPLPPPVFSYCSNVDNLDIPFPDWSFWGWPEIDLRAWDNELSEILKGENYLLWEQRQHTAFWKGNTNTGGKLRKYLLSCHGAHYGAEIIHQDWWAAANAHYENSRLSQQCKNRYKVYAEGRGWSVSLKYILACDSPVLLVDPVFHDFFSRGLMPMRHFWPIGRDKLCKSIKFAVEWGNNNTHEAEMLGRLGRQFITKEVSMKHAYDYMLHVLHEYAKLLQFEPLAGKKMKEVCSEEMLCLAPERERASYEESMVRQPSGKPPCFLGPRDKKLMEDRLQQRVSMSKLVHQAEDIGGFLHKVF